MNREFRGKRVDGKGVQAIIIGNVTDNSELLKGGGE